MRGEAVSPGRAIPGYGCLWARVLPARVEEHLHGYAVALDVRHGDGHVILLGMRPQWRAQSYGTFRVLFNAALYSSEVAATVQASEAFWEPPVREDADEQEEKPSGR